MLGTVFHYAVVEPKSDHAQCDAQRQGIIAYHERNGYKAGGAYNGHFCIHGGSWLSYAGPNQATGNTWANLNLEAWCYLGTVDTPVTADAQQTAYELTLRNPRDRIHPHSDFFQTSCCGDPLRAWITSGAPPSAPAPPPPPPPTVSYPEVPTVIRAYQQNNDPAGEWHSVTVTDQGELVHNWWDQTFPLNSNVNREVLSAGCKPNGAIEMRAGVGGNAKRIDFWVDTTDGQVCHAWRANNGDPWHVAKYAP